jgi:asparagine synthase (glutamine-hydrolysing)
MCGIVTLFGEKRDVPTGLLSHRGPDDYRTETMGKCRMDFYRLAINDLTDAGMQPFVRPHRMFVCNGEIYNHRSLRNGEEKSKSDCEVVMNLVYTIGIENTLKSINGDFAFTYTDGKRVIAARDPVGVRPMFYTRYAKDSIAFASEAKALMFLGTHIEIFPPGHFYDSYIDSFVAYHSGYWHIFKFSGSKRHENIRQVLEEAVHTRLDNTDREIGFLLSGGLDSSLIAAIAARKLGTIKTFSIGLEGSPDLEAARKVADFLVTDHTEVTFTVEEGLCSIRNVIQTLESYDTTTVRASTPMWLLCKYIKENTNCRYIFSGEGSDEVLGGYLYFHNAPGVEEFACENMRRLKLIHQFDGLRADRCAGAHGLDLIVPFLDKNFIQCCMEIDQKLKMTKLEKQVLREAFVGYLPDEVLWRQKDGMSDAVGTGWVGALRQHAEDFMSDQVFEITRNMCKHNPPLTKEEAYYRELFWMFYDSRNDHLISEIWRPKWTNITDPSARLLIEKNPK